MYINVASWRYYRDVWRFVLVNAYLSNLLSHEVGAGGSREAEVMSLLQKDYDFTSDGKRKKTTGFDFIFDTGTSSTTCTRSRQLLRTYSGI